jgi:hypothetical protein
MRGLIKVGGGVFISGGIASAVMIAKQVIEGSFLEQYGYGSLVQNKIAKAAYLPTVIATVAETVAVTVFLVFSTVALIRLVMKHTGVDPNSKKYSVFEAARHRQSRLWILAFGLGGVIVFAVKLANAWLKNFSYIKNIVTSEGISTITMTALPWFGSLLFFATVGYILLSAFVTSKIKDDIVFSYGSDGKL